MHVDVYVDPGALPDDVGGDAGVLARVVAAHRVHPQLRPPPDLLPQPPSVSAVYRVSGCGLVVQNVASELHPKVRNHGEGPY